MSDMSLMKASEGNGNTDDIPNRWNQGQLHYECRHDECFVVGSARLYFALRRSTWLIGTPSTLPSPHGSFAHLSPVILSPQQSPMLWIIICVMSGGSMLPTRRLGSSSEKAQGPTRISPSGD